MKIKGTITVLVMLTLYSCATSPTAQMDALNAAPICCSGTRDLPVTGSLANEATLEISDSSPVFDFSTGRSRFAAVALPPAAAGRRLSLRTFVGPLTTVDGMGGHSYLFPVATFLDESRNIVGFSSPENLTAQCYGFGCTSTFVGSVRIPPTSRIAVIHTTPSAIGRTYIGSMSGPGTTVMIGRVPVNVTGSGDAPVRARFSATGKIIVAVLPE